jgi:hypothetical protein
MKAVRCEYATNILNNQSQTDKGWFFSLGLFLWLRTSLVIFRFLLWCKCDLHPSGMFLQCGLVVGYQHFSRTAWPWKMGLIVCPKMLVANYYWFQASAMMLMRSVLFWDIMWCHVVIVYWRFRTTFLLGLLTLEDGTDTLCRKVGKQLPYDAA